MLTKKDYIKIVNIFNKNKPVNMIGNIEIEKQ